MLKVGASVANPRKSIQNAILHTLFVVLLALIVLQVRTPLLAATDSEGGLSQADEGSLATPFMDLLTVGGDRAQVDEHFNNGKWTLVMLWATNCHVCHEQKPMISAAHDERKDVDFTVMGIAIDGRRGIKKVKRYLDKNQPSFPNFVGDLSIVAVNYQILTEESFRGTPTYLLFNPENKLMAAQPGRVSKEALFEFIAKNS